MLSYSKFETNLVYMKPVSKLTNVIRLHNNKTGHHQIKIHGSLSVQKSSFGELLQPLRPKGKCYQIVRLEGKGAQMCKRGQILHTVQT